jgi:hypothetical protein
MELLEVGSAVPPVATRQRATVSVSAVVLAMLQLTIVQAKGVRKYTTLPAESAEPPPSKVKVRPRMLDGEVASGMRLSPRVFHPDEDLGPHNAPVDVLM